MPHVAAYGAPTRLVARIAGEVFDDRHRPMAIGLLASLLPIGGLASLSALLASFHSMRGAYTTWARQQRRPPEAADARQERFVRQ